MLGQWKSPVGRDTCLGHPLSCCTVPFGEEAAHLHISVFTCGSTGPMQPLVAMIRVYSCRPASPCCSLPSCFEKERVVLISHMAWSFICRGKLKCTLLVSILHANFDIAFQECLAEESGGRSALRNYIAL